MNEEQARTQAKRERGFYGHLASYLICNAFFAALNLFASPSEIWFIFPMLAWGVGLASHAVSVFGLPGRGAGWEERRVRELMGAEGSTERLKSLLDEELGRRKRAGSGPEAQSEAARLRERIEHLEAIVTSRDWDTLETSPAVAPVPLPESEGSDAATEAARIARRVR
jgi:hypothetical protein